MKRALVAAVAMGAAVAVAPAAQADEIGGGATQFLEIAKGHIAGLQHDDGDAGLVDLAGMVCDHLAATGGYRGRIQQKFANAWHSESDAAWFITASAVAFCPEYIVESDRW